MVFKAVKNCDLRVIAFSGPDGTGKTTCAKLISEFLSAKGYYVIRAWVKTTHNITFVIITLLEKLNPRHVVRSTSGTFVTNSLARSWRIWTWIEFIGVLLKILTIKIRLTLLVLTLKKKTVIIADRYLLDTLVHILLSLILSKRENKLQWLQFMLSRCSAFKIIRAIMLKHAFIVLLDGEISELLRRNMKANKADPYWYMVLQRLLYHKLVKSLNIPHTYIDTTRKTARIVCMEVLSRLKEQGVVRY